MGFSPMAFALISGDWARSKFVSDKELHGHGCEFKSYRGCWEFLVDAIPLRYFRNGEGSLKRSIITLSPLNFELASWNQGAYSIFGTDFGAAPFNWSAGASNPISATPEHIARGSDYDIFDEWARNISLHLGQAVEAVGFGNDLDLTVSKQAGCRFGDQFCLDVALWSFEPNSEPPGPLYLRCGEMKGEGSCQVPANTVTNCGLINPQTLTP